MTYRVQKGKLNGTYKDVLETENESQARGCYFGMKIKAGEKKRLQEIPELEGNKPETLYQLSQYWT